MRLSPRTIALLLFVVSYGAPALHSQNPAAIPVSPPSTSPAPAQPHKPVVKKARRHRRPHPVDLNQKVVVRHGGTSDAVPQMAPVEPQHRDPAERRKSGLLLTATEANLKSLADRKLTADEQATVAQIHQFLAQSRTALDAGDLTQGYNFASKANILSEELVKR